MVNFLDTGYEACVSDDNILSGRVKDFMIPIICGIGYMGNPNSRKGNEYLYSVWRKMIERCYNPSHNCYKSYGLIGIKVDSRWHCFDTFLKDVCCLEGYDNELLSNKLIQLDKDKKQQEIPKGKRIYSKDTCVWITKKENNQIRNKENAKTFEAINKDGEIFKSNNIKEFSKEYNLKYDCVYACLIGRQKQHKNWRFKYVEC